MRIAFDGEFLRLPPSGIGGYVRNLVPALQTAAPAFELFVVEPDWDHSGQDLAKSRGPLVDRRIQRASWELLGFARAARRFKPDLLHVPSFAAPAISPAPLVVTIHDVIPFVLPVYRASAAMRLHLAAMRRTVRRAALILAPSHSAATEISSELGIARDRIRVTYEAADPACRPIEERSTGTQIVDRFGIAGRYVFNVGGLDVRKNVPLLIEAFAQLLPTLSEPVQLVIAGAPHSDNPTVFPPLEPVIRRCGVERDVILTGRVTEAEKIALYQSADLYVTPSAHEGFGLTALEAMACGVPTIAANGSSFPEIVGDGGVLAELDVESLATAMFEVLENQALAADLRLRGLARARAFSWERTAEQTLDVYREVLSTRRS
jgi:glycosyltransferase involved in cell wall biosynthesis